MGWDVSPIRLLLSKDEKTTGGQEEEGGKCNMDKAEEPKITHVQRKAVQRA